MKARKYYRTSSLVSIIAMLAAAGGLVIALFTDVSATNKIVFMILTTVLAVVVSLVNRVRKETYFEGLEERLESEDYDKLRGFIRSERALRKAGVPSDAEVDALLRTEGKRKDAEPAVSHNPADRADS